MRILDVVIHWAKTQKDILGIALLGSYARNSALPDSDIDLVVLATNPARFRDPGWMSTIDWTRAGLFLTGWSDEEYGAVWSHRLWFEPEGEVEISFAGLSWADITPVDPGTIRVVSDGFQILHDPDRRLERLMLAVTS
jgi:uncharacterized protein